jgi:hypothetical protein
MAPARRTGHAKIRRARPGLPIGNGQVLMLNPQRNVDALDFKRGQTATILKMGTVVAAFDNEMANARMLRQLYPQSTRVFRLNTSSHADDPGGEGPILVISDYAPAEG